MPGEGTVDVSGGRSGEIGYEAMNSRREFFGFLAASPFAAALLKGQDVPSTAKEALDIMDFEEAAHRKVPISHWAYMATGVDDDATLHANREGLMRIKLRPRRLVDVSKVDTSVELFGTKWPSPVYISACGSQKAFHPEGEVATAHGAKAKNAAQMLSSVSSTSVEDVAQALGRPPWYQMYAPSTLPMVDKMIHRVEAAGCTVMMLTVDVNPGRNTETQKRLSKADTRQCNMCHKSTPGDSNVKPMFQGLDRGMNSPSFDWKLVDHIKQTTKMKLFIKGLETHEDAELAIEHGADGIVCSNHGGRAMDSCRPSIDSLVDVLGGARGRVPVFVDGGFRRGSDVFKALALGAKAVGIGRPYLWGLGAFGQEGVERVLDIFRAELTLTMRQCGTRSLNEINKSYLA
ncbi:MAG: alpha-hydroxy-acid oxidizing protein [Acidobacteriia bacterium]|nr:alpha-hydroxy-acid oxidizing protein [Terriglobia bacterium]